MGYINDYGEYIKFGEIDTSRRGQEIILAGSKRSATIAYDTPCPVCDNVVSRFVGSHKNTLLCGRCDNQFYPPADDYKYV